MPTPPPTRRKFYLFQLWFAIPGVILLVTSFVVPVGYMYRQIYWTRTEGLFIEQIITNDGEDAITVVEFAAADGKTYRVESNGESLFTGSDDKHYLLYYNPENPEQFMMLNHGLYLMLLFIPFGLLLCYLGWPHREGFPAESADGGRG